VKRQIRTAGPLRQPRPSGRTEKERYHACDGLASPCGKPVEFDDTASESFHFGEKAIYASRMIRFSDLRGDPVSLDIERVSHAQPDGSNTLIVMQDGSSVRVRDPFEVVAERVCLGANDNGYWRR
jgi:hypothetical protein